jgi:hypothetical protein
MNAHVRGHSNSLRTGIGYSNLLYIVSSICEAYKLHHMARVQQYLIAARFITTMGHFVALLMLFSTIENNIDASLPDNYTSMQREEATKIAWVRAPPIYMHFEHSILTGDSCLHVVGFDNRLFLLRVRLRRNVFWNFAILQYCKLSVAA